MNFLRFPENSKNLFNTSFNKLYYSHSSLYDLLWIMSNMSKLMNFLLSTKICYFRHALKISSTDFCLRPTDPQWIYCTLNCCFHNIHVFTEIYSMCIVYKTGMVRVQPSQTANSRDFTLNCPGHWISISFI